MSKTDPLTSIIVRLDKDLELLYQKMEELELRIKALELMKRGKGL